MEERVTMEKLFYKPEHAWVGDLIPYWEDGIFYGFYLHDPRIKDKEYAEETTWHLVTTKDFVNLEYKGEAIERGGDDKPNKNIYTGSVIKDKDGIYHAFYTAFNADIKIKRQKRAVRDAGNGNGSLASGDDGGLPLCRGRRKV